MNGFFYTEPQLKVFAQDLVSAFLGAGFEIVEEPNIDYALCGFRATYIRRYLLHPSISSRDDSMTTLIHVVGLPFGHHGQKMVILSAARNLKNEPICETLKLRVHFDQNDYPYVVYGDKQTSNAKNFQTRIPNGDNLFAHINATFNRNQSNQREESTSSSSHNDRQDHDNIEKFSQDLANYVAHIIETISPGLIRLPTEMKLEILKKLSVDSIIRMSQVNSEFRSLIFQRGESLWRHLCSRDFNINSINRLVHRSWMELYRDRFLIHQIEICRKERALPGLPERPALPPAPYRLQIEWLPEVLALPIYPEDVVNRENEIQYLALEFHPLRRANSLDSLP